MVRNTKVPELESEADQMSNKVRGVNAPVNEDSTEDVGMMCWRIDGGLR